MLLFAFLFNSAQVSLMVPTTIWVKIWITEHTYIHTNRKHCMYSHMFKVTSEKRHVYIWPVKNSCIADDKSSLPPVQLWSKNNNGLLCQVEKVMLRRTLYFGCHLCWNTKLFSRGQKSHTAHYPSHANVLPFTHRFLQLLHTLSIMCPYFISAQLDAFTHKNLKYLETK